MIVLLLQINYSILCIVKSDKVFWAFGTRWCRLRQVRRNNEAKDAHAYIYTALQSFTLINFNILTIKKADCDLVRCELTHSPHHTIAIIVVAADHISSRMQAYLAMRLELNRHDTSILQKKESVRVQAWLEAHEATSSILIDTSVRLDI